MILPATLQKLQQDLTANPGPETASRILAEYFSFFSLPSIHQELWTLTGAALTHEDLHIYNRASTRNDLIFFYEFTRLMIEAAEIITTTPHKKSN